MSRVGKKLIVIPSGVEVKISDDLIVVKGPKGELQQKIHPRIKIFQEEGKLKITVDDTEEKLGRSLWGLFGSLVSNMVEGVTKGFEKKLEINGIGFKAAVSGKKLVLNVGYSHPVEYALPAGINAAVEKNIITISGADKQLVGKVTAEIRQIRKPEPYKGKGIKYIDEVVRRKAGKTVKTAGA
ncbi:MAG: 50S ribosomal protein L6 [Patescibacteria group bacterium]|nr:50S ribosomal protein L6 [Patescibacteria group bacterium]